MSRPKFVMVVFKLCYSLSIDCYIDAVVASPAIDAVVASPAIDAVVASPAIF
jgi:hypothetical protein